MTLWPNEMLAAEHRRDLLRAAARHPRADPRSARRRLSWGTLLAVLRRRRTAERRSAVPPATPATPTPVVPEPRPEPGAVHR